MKKILFFVILSASAIGCTNMNDAEFVNIISMGAKVKEIKCTQEAGGCEFYIVANEWVAYHDTVSLAYDAKIIEGAEWMRFKENGSDAMSRNGSGIIAFEYTANRSVRRCGRILLQSGNRVDSLKVKQEGKYQETVKLVSDLEPGYKVPAEGGTYTFTIESNILPAELQVKAAKGLGESFIRANILTVTILPSDSRDDRKIDVTVYKVDAWGEEISSTVTLTQIKGKIL